MRNLRALTALVSLALGCGGTPGRPPVAIDAAAPSGTGGSTPTGGSGGSSTPTGGMEASGGSGGGGSGGATATGGAPSSPDAAPVVSADASAADATSAPSSDGPAALMECATPSIDCITWWKATGEGKTVPAKEGATLLVKEGDRYVAKEQFVGGGWHVLEVIITNDFGKAVDLTKSTGFTLSYNTTADLYIQLRPAFAYDGGDKWVIKIPSSAGMDTTATFPFTGWTSISDLGKPSYTFAKALTGASGFVFVGDAANTITLRSLRIDGYTPVCN